MSPEKFRAWQWHKQGLDGRFRGSLPGSVLAATGWARSVGGANPYLTLFARAATSRAEAEQAAAALAIHELPTVRGCTYVLPASDFALGLKAGEPASQAPVKVAEKLGVTASEVRRLCDSVVRALESGAQDPGELRASTGSAWRSLGPEGVKKGMSTTLPLALGLLQALGEIRRVPVNGRLDQQRYKYVLWRPNPLAGFALDAAAVNFELARRYFAWTGPATAAEFQWFSGLGVKTAKAAIEAAGLERFDNDRYAMPGDRDAFEAFRIPDEPQYALVSSLDGIALLRRDLRGLLDVADKDRMVAAEKGSAAIGSLSDLPAHGIFDRGRLIGLWEFDTASGAIAWMSFGKANGRLLDAVANMEEFVRDLGDARSFSLDSPKSRAPRIEALRRAASH